ncbi:hypothetical protein HanIR_Chr09g0390801 [Helianthus annuus]|nr:hypothetical protein HanIR_Chr09g0390801 [Helianthus annuus]
MFVVYHFCYISGFWGFDTHLVRLHSPSHHLIPLPLMMDLTVVDYLFLLFL